MLFAAAQAVDIKQSGSLLDKNESVQSWLERTQREKLKCLEEGEQKLNAIEVPQELITLEQVGTYHQLFGHKMSDLIPITPQAKQLCTKVSAAFKQYKSEAAKKACQDYEQATKPILSGSQCSLLEVLPEQAAKNAKLLTREDNGVHKFNLYRKGCHLMNIS